MLNYKLNILVISIKSSEHNNNDKKKNKKMYKPPFTSPLIQSNKNIERKIYG